MSEEVSPSPWRLWAARQRFIAEGRVWVLERDTEIEIAEDSPAGDLERVGWMEIRAAWPTWKACHNSQGQEHTGKWRSRKR